VACLQEAQEAHRVEDAGVDQAEQEGGQAAGNGQYEVRRGARGACSNAQAASQLRSTACSWLDEPPIRLKSQELRLAAVTSRSFA
jgi:hypothetical protein